MDTTAQEEHFRRMDKLKKFKKPIRTPTEDEYGLTHYWVPTQGNKVFSAAEAPGETYVIEAINKDYPEQAIVTNIDNKKQVIYLQDWNWAPAPKELDEILERFGLKVLGDSVMKINSKFSRRKPENLKDYVVVIRDFRMFSYGTGVDVLKEYFDKDKPNALPAKKW